MVVRATVNGLYVTRFDTPASAVLGGHHCEYISVPRMRLPFIRVICESAVLVYDILQVCPAL